MHVGSESRVRDGARAVLPLALAVVLFGVSFGVLARAAGMGVLPPVVMSATTFAGSAQFAVVSILGGAGSVAAAVAAAVLLNARYAPMSIAVAPGFRGPLWRRLVGAQLIVDESWALSARGGGRFDVPVLLGAGMVLYPCWIGGTVLGVLGGEGLGDPERLGLDAAFPALFLALLVPQLRTRRALAAALTGAAIACILVPLSSPGIPIVAASAACLLGWRR
ncbi:MAG: AzlC family ABC transporter permease [Actinobacteria bacterium]|nr:AzlC family ABC transporter permease [Actinomycetota bacterium]